VQPIIVSSEPRVKISDMEEGHIGEAVITVVTNDQPSIDFRGEYWGHQSSWLLFARRFDSGKRKKLGV
jgi:hypothetical protein